MQIQPAISQSHSMLTPGQPVPGLALECQAPGWGGRERERERGGGHTGRDRQAGRRTKKRGRERQTETERQRKGERRGERESVCVGRRGGGGTQAKTGSG